MSSSSTASRGFPQLYLALHESHWPCEGSVRKVISFFIKSGAKSAFSQSDISAVIGTLCKASYKAGIVDQVLIAYTGLKLVERVGGGSSFKVTAFGATYFTTATFPTKSQDSDEEEVEEVEQIFRDKEHEKRQKKLSEMPGYSFSLTREGQDFVFRVNALYLLSMLEKSEDGDVLVKF